MYWALLGIFHSIFRAVFAEVNRNLKLDAWQLTLWNAVIAVIILVPFIPFMAWPSESEFYLAAFLVALVFTVGNVIQLNLVTVQMGRVSGMSIPMEALIGGLIWIFIWESAMEWHKEHQILSFLIGTSFLLASIAVLNLRRHDISLRTFTIVFPVAFSYAVAGIVTKLVIPYDNIMPYALAFVLVNFIIMAVVMTVVLAIKGKLKKEALFDAKMVMGGGMTGVCSMFAYFTFVTSVVYAPNPGYTSLLALLIPIWLMWYHEIRGQSDKASAGAALTIVLSIIALIGITMFY